MPSLRSLFNFGGPKGYASPETREDKPTRSSSMPTFNLTHKIRSLGRSSSFKVYKQKSHKGNIATEGAPNSVESNLSFNAASLHGTSGVAEKTNPSSGPQSSVNVGVSPHSRCPADVASACLGLSISTRQKRSNSLTILTCNPQFTIVDAASADGAAGEATSPQHPGEHIDSRFSECSPVDEAVVLMLQELDDSVLAHTICFEATEVQPLETIYEELDGDELPHPATADSRLSSGTTSSKLSGAITLVEPASDHTRQGPDITDIRGIVPTSSSLMVSHGSRVGGGEWEEGETLGVSSYVEAIPPLSQPFHFQRRTTPCMTSQLRTRDPSVSPVYCDYEGVD